MQGTVGEEECAVENGLKGSEGDEQRVYKEIHVGEERTLLSYLMRCSLKRDHNAIAFEPIHSVYASMG